MKKYEVRVYYDFKQPTFYIMSREKDAIEAVAFAKENGVFADYKEVEE